MEQQNTVFGGNFSDYKSRSKKQCFPLQGGSMTSRPSFMDEKDSVLGELAVRMKKLSTDGCKQTRGKKFTKNIFLSDDSP